MTIYQECDYAPYFKSSPAPYTRGCRKTYFSIGCDQIVRTNQNHKFWWCCLPWWECFLVWYLCESALVCAWSRCRNRLGWRSKMLCLRSGTSLCGSSRISFLCLRIQEIGKLCLCLQNCCIIDKCIRGLIISKYVFLVLESLWSCYWWGMPFRFS